MENQCWRVKLYQLEIGGIWNDHGTGFVSCEQVVSDDTADNPSYTTCLMVRKEENNAVLLQSTIQYEDAYERQGESIIMWRENCFVSGKEIDYALSFENTAGCYAIWDAINDVQAYPYKISVTTTAASTSTLGASGRRSTREASDVETQYHDEEWLPVNGYIDKSNNEREEMCMTYAMTGSSPGATNSPSLLMHELASSYIGLPSVSVENLVEIKDKILNAFPSQKEVYASIIRDQDGEYLQKLIQLSESSRGTGEMGPCRIIAEIIRGIVYLNDPETLELLIKTHDTFSRVAGAMELDPLLQEVGIFKEVLARAPRGPRCVVDDNFGTGSCENDSGDVCSDKANSSEQSWGGRGRGHGCAAHLVTKLFRARMLKDILIRPLPDESGASSLNTLLFSLQSAVCEQLFNDTAYLGKVLNLIATSHNTNTVNGVLNRSCLKHVKESNNSSNNVEKISDKHKNVNCEVLKRTKMKSGLCFLRELFFMSRQLSIEQRSELYSNCLNELRIPFFSALRSTLCLRYDEKPLEGVEGVGVPQESSCEEKNSPYVLASAIRVMAAEILSSVTLVCPSFLRQAIIEGAVPTPPPYCSAPAPSSSSSSRPPSSSGDEEKEGSGNDCSILYVIIERTCCDEEAAVIEHLGETIKILLDPERMDKLEKDRFLALFYDFYVQWLLVPFAHSVMSPDEVCRITPANDAGPKGSPRISRHQEGASNVARSEEQQGEDKVAGVSSPCLLPDVSVAKPISRDLFSAISSSRRFLCEIFSQCATSHLYRMKFFIVRNNVISRVLKLLKSRHKHMHIGAVKFIRAILTVKDEFYHKHIVKYDLLKPMFDLFEDICMKDNLITSAIVEIIDYIRSERIMTLVCYLVEKYKSIFDLCLGEEVGALANNIVSDIPTSVRQEQQRSNVGKLLHVEVFQKFLYTYEQMQEPNTTIHAQRHLGGSGSEQDHFGVVKEVGATRRLMNKNLAEIESEEAYFYDVDDEGDAKEAVHAGDREIINGASGQEYGPVVSSESASDTKNVRKRSYFDDLDSVRPNQRGVRVEDKDRKPMGVPAIGAKIKSNSLKLICDIYGEDDGEETEDGGDGNRGGTSAGETEMTITDIVHSSSDSRTSRICYSPPPPGLPPLRSKFEQDSDEDEDDDGSIGRAVDRKGGTPRFFQSKMFSRGSPVMKSAGKRPSSNSSSSSVVDSDNVSSLSSSKNGESLANRDGSSGGIKFSLKKKTKYF